MAAKIDPSEAQNRCWTSPGSFQDHLGQSFLCFRTEADKCVEMGVVWVVWRPGARPWKHHGISIESPSNLHGGNIDFATTRALYKYTGLSESAGLQ